jgi:hypothetical protein
MLNRSTSTFAIVIFSSVTALMNKVRPGAMLSDLQKPSMRPDLFLRRIHVGQAPLRVQEGPDETTRGTETRAVAGVGIEDQLSVAQSLEHCVGVVRRHHGVVAALTTRAGWVMARRVAFSGSGVAHQVLTKPPIWST